MGLLLITRLYKIGARENYDDIFIHSAGVFVDMTGNIWVMAEQTQPICIMKSVSLI